MSSDAIFNQLIDHFGKQPNHNGFVNVECPFCGKRGKFGFCDKYYKCFSGSCVGTGSLWDLAEKLRVGFIAVETATKITRNKEQPLRDWQQSPDPYINRYCEAFDRIEAWQRYKPLSLDMIAHWRLGVGKLPFTDENGRVYFGKYRRLIVPTFSQGKLVALEGRAFHPDDTGAKWICATGSNKRVLFNADLLKPGCTVIICENKTDALLVMQAAPDVVAVAGGGASWQDAWTAQIAQSKPKQVLVWLDNDGPGCPNAETYRAFVADWKQKHPQADRIPEPNGPKIANALLEAGVKASVYQWPNGTPAKADIGMALMRDQVAV
jgi:phage/plasmid primase-like uncharacterized protein